MPMKTSRSKLSRILPLMVATVLANQPLVSFAETQTWEGFGGAFAADSKYWGDGKAELSYFDILETRYGQTQPGQLTIMLVREPFAPEELVKADDWRREGTYGVLKMNQIYQIQTGTYDYLQMFSGFWKTDNSQFIKWSLTSNDGCGNTFKLGERQGDDWKILFHTYWEGMVSGELTVPAVPEVIYYDELPFRVRTLDFSKDTQEFEIQLIPGTINSKKGNFTAAPATVSLAAPSDAEKTQRVVTVIRADGTDRFVLDAEFPHLLRVWEKADGSVATLKSALKLAYWEMNKPGDRERALADETLRLD